MLHVTVSWYQMIQNSITYVIQYRDNKKNKCTVSHKSQNIAYIHLHKSSSIEIKTHLENRFAAGIHTSFPLPCTIGTIFDTGMDCEKY